MHENIKIRLEANQSLILQKYNQFWMITSGEADVFYVDIDKNGKYLSTLKYLYSVKSGELLFSLITDKIKEKNIKLLLVSKGVSLLAINKNKLLAIDHLFLKSMIDQWIIKTTEAIQQNARLWWWGNLFEPQWTTRAEAPAIIFEYESLISFPTHINC